MFNIINQNFQFSTPFLRGYKELRIPIIDADGMPAWPDVFSLERIEQMRETVGARHFSSQMMLEYIDEEKTHLDPGALHFYDCDFDARTAKLGENLITGVAAYWDPSIGGAKSDASVCVLIYRDDKNRRAFVHDIRYFRVAEEDIHPMTSQCEAVLDFMQMHGLRKIALESNGLGVALPEILTDIAKKRDRGVIVQKITNSKMKRDRILNAIEPLLTTGRLYAHERLKSTPFLAEMLGWSPIVGAQRDDGLDAVAGALRLIPTPVRNLSATMRPLTAKTDFKV